MIASLSFFPPTAITKTHLSFFLVRIYLHVGRTLSPLRNSGRVFLEKDPLPFSETHFPVALFSNLNHPPPSPLLRCWKFPDPPLSVLSLGNWRPVCLKKLFLLLPAESNEILPLQEAGDGGLGTSFPLPQRVMTNEPFFFLLLSFASVWTKQLVHPRKTIRRYFRPSMLFQTIVNRFFLHPSLNKT